MWCQCLLMFLQCDLFSTDELITMTLLNIPGIWLYDRATKIDSQMTTLDNWIIIFIKLKKQIFFISNFSNMTTWSYSLLNAIVGYHVGFFDICLSAALFVFFLILKNIHYRHLWETGKLKERAQEWQQRSWLGAHPTLASPKSLIT